MAGEHKPTSRRSEKPNLVPMISKLACLALEVWAMMAARHKPSSPVFLGEAHKRHDDGYAVIRTGSKAGQCVGM